MANADDRLRVLMSAFACGPGRGSEPGSGWETVRALAPRHDLTVVTRSMYRSSIEQEVARQGRLLEDVTFVYLDTHVLPEAWLNGSSWGANLIYFIWQARLRRWVQVHAERFDIAHHVTFVRYWMAPGVSGVPGLPCVIGPVGGADSAPPSLVRSLSLRGRIAEWTREAVRAAFARLPALRRGVGEAAVCLATSPAAVTALRRLGARDVRLAPDVYVRPEAIAAVPSVPRDGEPLVVAAGPLIEWKAYHLAIMAWVRSGVRGRLAVYGRGPSLGRLRRLAVRLGVADRVEFPGVVPRDEFFATLRHASIYLHPSLHDSGGTVIVEAMQFGVPVVCWDHAGPGEMVDDSCGAAVEIDPRGLDTSLEAMSIAIHRLVTDRSARRVAAEGALERARVVLNTEAHADRIESAYRVAQQRGRRKLNAINPDGYSERVPA